MSSFVDLSMFSFFFNTFQSAPLNANEISFLSGGRSAFINKSEATSNLEDTMHFKIHFDYLLIRIEGIQFTNWIGAIFICELGECDERLECFQVIQWIWLDQQTSGIRSISWSTLVQGSLEPFHIRWITCNHEIVKFWFIWNELLWFTFFIRWFLLFITFAAMICQLLDFVIFQLDQFAARIVFGILNRKIIIFHTSNWC